MKLYCYWQSSCAWRVRLTLAYKGVPYEYRAVNGSAELQSKEFRALNPLGMVPALETSDGIISDSIAIIEYLEEKFPQKPLFPKDLAKKAAARQIVNLIASNIQPLQAVTVTKVVSEKLNANEVLGWNQHWITTGCTALEEILQRTSGKYCLGDQITVADVVLLPQVRNAVLYEVNLAGFPVIARLYNELLNLPEFQDTLPHRQPDAPTST